MTPAFPLPLKFSDAGMRGGSRLFALDAPFEYVGSVIIRVPEGFVTDGASVPRLFWSLLGPFGSYFSAAIIHDFLYSEHNRIFPRQECDWIFLEAMAASGVGWLTRRTIYRAVRLGGASRFKGRLS
jgi:hypothetical protein